MRDYTVSEQNKNVFVARIYKILNLSHVGLLTDTFYLRIYIECDLLHRVFIEQDLLEVQITQLL